ncbi:MAG: leucine-rich repeat domain-containing protein [Clostridia bacterium]|nr:leucine-rich repeat domain-containing protein [Clostridia bacterium]
MILKYKYHSDSGLLEAYRSYTLAQNNSLSDTIVITSTAPDAERYNYCLEFICYNSKSIPKAQYISPILNYSDGISFAVPNNLTEFRGHVDMQLTGYDPDDNSIVFKSISKNCKAFDVEGSLCVLEKDLNDTPNVFTEVLKQLEELKNIHQDIIDEAMSKFGEQILDMVAKYKWCKVKFYDNGKLLEEQWVTAGSKLTQPQYTLPNNCVLVGGWYNPATESIWDMDNDTVQESMELALNYMTDDVVIYDGTVYSFGRYTRSQIYLPEYYEGHKVNAILENGCGVPYESRLHLGNNLEYFEGILNNPNVLGLYFPQNHPYVISANGYLYAKTQDEFILFFAPKLDQTDTLVVMDGCMALNTFAINSVRGLRKIILPNSMEYLLAQCIANTDIETLRLPPNIRFLDDRAVYNNFKLKDIIIEGDISGIITDETFVNEDVKGAVTHPTLWVYPQYYANYKERGLVYDIQVIGQEYLDGRYALKGE